MILMPQGAFHFVLSVMHPWTSKGAFLQNC